MHLLYEDAEVIIINFVCQKDLTTLEIDVCRKIMEFFPGLKELVEMSRLKV